MLGGERNVAVGNDGGRRSGVDKKIGASLRLSSDFLFEVTARDLRIRSIQQYP